MYAYVSFVSQVYVAAVSPARNPASSYQVRWQCVLPLEQWAVLTFEMCFLVALICQAWGHTSVVSPWGVVVATTSHEPALVMAELDLESVDEVRRNIPVSLQKRTDLYNLAETQA